MKTTEVSREAGRDLDVAVAERVMGYRTRKQTYPMGSRGDGLEKDGGPWTPVYRDEYELCNPDGEPIMVHGELMHGYFACPVPNYSTEIAAAWAVVEKMREHPNVHLRTLTLRAYSYSRTYAAFTDVNLLEDDEHWTEANGEHATPLAICLAALAALSRDKSVTERP